MKCPKCNARISDAAVLGEAGKIASARRQTHGAGTGRPPILRTCACGETMGTAAYRDHRCEHKTTQKG